MAAKTYLELCNDTKRECRVAGPDMTSVSGNAGLLNDIVRWVRGAWNEIQNEHPQWRWMRAPFSLAVTVGNTSYTYAQCIDTRTTVAIDRFASWWAHDRLAPFKCYRNAGGIADESWLIYMDWREFERLYLLGANRTTPGKPIYVTVDHNENLVVHPVPTEACTITGDYQRGPQTLSTNGDIPDFPQRFHDLIFYRAMERYGSGNIAVEVLNRSITEGGRLMAALEMSQLERFTPGRPLA